MCLSTSYRTNDINWWCGCICEDACILLALILLGMHCLCIIRLTGDRYLVQIFVQQERAYSCILATFYGGNASDLLVYSAGGPVFYCICGRSRRTVFCRQFNLHVLCSGCVYREILSVADLDLDSVRMADGERSIYSLQASHNTAPETVALGGVAPGGIGAAPGLSGDAETVMHD